MPEEIVIYKRGEVVTPPPPPMPPIPKIIPPELLQIIVLDDIQVALTKVNKHLEKAEFEGVVDPRTFAVTDEMRGIALIHDWPFTPWITASFFNDGPNRAYIALNYIFDWASLEKGESANMDFSRSDRRIQFVHYKCDAGEKATVRVIGKY
ncbi:unnamed protein product [marine sediment metagenome]|uniref:Uncharacterized protein n=1 Tax=marine sediment metagenome TaxID=412755 RepID=X1SL34_9ZZZZ